MTIALHKTTMCMYLEPVNCAAVDKRREHSESGSEGIADRTHGQYDMQLIPHTINEHVEEGKRSAICLLGLFSTPVYQ